MCGCVVGGSQWTVPDIIHTHTHTRTHTHTHTHARTHTHTCGCLVGRSQGTVSERCLKTFFSSAKLGRDFGTCGLGYICVCVCMHVCVCVCHARVCVSSTRIQTHTHTLSLSLSHTHEYYIYEYTHTHTFSLSHIRTICIYTYIHIYTYIYKKYRVPAQLNLLGEFARDIRSNRGPFVAHSHCVDHLPLHTSVKRGLY